MKKSQFLGLTILSPGEGLETDNFAFTGRDRQLIDYGIKVGAKTHRHDGASGLTDPTQTASATVLASGGTIAPGLTIGIGYTLEDAQGGETILSPTTSVTTGSPLSVPVAAPSAALVTTEGALLTNTYYYALTWTDGEGGETPAGPSIGVDRPPGFANAQIELSNLDFGMLAAGAKEWRLYRAVGGGSYDLMTTGKPGEKTFTDDGEQAVDCDDHPPQDGNNQTRQTNLLQVKLPNSFPAPDPELATFINLYGNLGGDFGESSFLGQYPLASAGAVVSFPAIEFGEASPPDVNTSFGGANKIDPDLELIDWHWKRPVEKVGDLPTEGEGAEDGDVRLVTEEQKAYLFVEGEWKPWQGGSGANELLEQAGMGFIFCGEDLTKARPVGFACVTWMTEGKGSEEPENMAEHDILVSLP